MYISSPLIRGGGWGLRRVGRAFSNLHWQPPAPWHGQWRSHPPIQATLAVRNRGIWVLAGSSPSSDAPQLHPQLLENRVEWEVPRLDAGGEDGCAPSSRMLQQSYSPVPLPGR